MNKKRVLISAFIVLIIMSFLGCSSAKDSSNMEADIKSNGSEGFGKTDNNEELRYEDGSFETSKFGEKMIYNARISIETLEFKKTLEDIGQYVASLDGFIESSSISGIGDNYNNSYKSRGYAEITYRVPAKQYAGFLKNIKNYGNVISESSNSQNVTSQYYDTEGRLKAYRISEERLLEILKKADEVTDMLEIERELTNVRANIEGMTTQLKSWDNLVEYSTATVAIREVAKITDTTLVDSFGKRLIKTIEKSFVGFVNFVKEVVIVIVYLIPYLIIIGFILFMVLYFSRKKKQKPEKKIQETEPPKK